MFRDRVDAGRQLAARVSALRLAEPVVLALPRGGVPVGAEVARALGVPLEVFVARKVGAPHQPELGIGAVAEDGGLVVGEAAHVLGLTGARFERLVAAEREQVAQRVRACRGARLLPDLRERDVVLVDDGLATGVTAEAALTSLRARRPSRLVLAAPVCAPDAADRLAEVADHVVCVLAPPEMRAVGLWYADFDQTTDREVIDLLAAGAEGRDRNAG